MTQSCMILSLILFVDSFFFFLTTVCILSTFDQALTIAEQIGGKFCPTEERFQEAQKFLRLFYLRIDEKGSNFHKGRIVPIYVVILSTFKTYYILLFSTHYMYDSCSHCQDKE